MRTLPLCATVLLLASLSGWPDLAGAIGISTSNAQTLKIGEQTVLPNADSGNANLLLVQGPYALTQAGTWQSLSFYVVQLGGQLRLGVFDATGPGGGPGRLVVQTNAFTPNVANGWNTAITSSNVTSQPGNYWIGYTPSSNALSFRKNATQGVSAKYYSKNFGAMPATFSTSPSTDPNHWSLYATLMQAAPPPPLAVSLNPTSANIACETTPGTTVSQIVTSGGNGGTITYSLSGDTMDFGLSSPTAPANIIVGPQGITPSSCGQLAGVSLIANQ